MSDEQEIKETAAPETQSEAAPESPEIQEAPAQSGEEAPV